MNVQEFENKLRDICSKNGWRVELGYTGIWEVTVTSKDTGEFLGTTGSTGLEAVLSALEIPFNECPWI